MFNQQEQKLERKKLSGNGNQLFFVNILIMEIGETDFTVNAFRLVSLSNADCFNFLVLN